MYSNCGCNNILFTCIVFTICVCSKILKWKDSKKGGIGEAINVNVTGFEKHTELDGNALSIQAEV